MKARRGTVMVRVLQIPAALVGACPRPTRSLRTRR